MGKLSRKFEPVTLVGGEHGNQLGGFVGPLVTATPLVKPTCHHNSDSHMPPRRMNVCSTGHPWSGTCDPSALSETDARKS